MSRTRDLRYYDGRLAMIVAQENGISRSAFISRIKKGWSVEHACTVRLNAHDRLLRALAKDVDRQQASQPVVSGGRTSPYNAGTDLLSPNCTALKQV